MEPVNVFGGTGFIGSRYVNTYSNCVVNERDDYVPKSNNILYFISTVDNYNVFNDIHVDIRTNLTVLMNVLSNIKDKENTVFNFISSWFVYGDTDLPAREDSCCNPKGFYSITKRTAEQLLISYCKTFNIKYRVLRLANVVCTDDQKVSKKKNAIVHMIKELKNNNPVNLYDGGDLYRDVIDIDDCVCAINLVLEQGELNTTYNIGNGVPVKLLDIIEAARNMLKSSSTINYIDAPEFHKIVQVKSMYMDNSKLKAIGYSQKFSIEEIIRRIIS